MPFMTTKQGVRLFYAEEGEGPPVVMLMGTSLDHTYWSAQVAAFKSGYRCIAIDNRGCGQSDVPPSGYPMSDLALDAFAVMDHLDIRKAHILGFSMGGSIAMAMALQDADRVLSLGLHSTSARLYPAIIHRYRILLKLLDLNDPDLWAEGTMYTAFDTTYIDNNGATVEEEVARRIQRFDRMGPKEIDGVRGHYLAFSQYDPWERIADIRLPTQVTVGTNDAVTPPRYARDLHNRIRGSQFHEFPGAPHRTTTFAAAEYNRVVLQFLNSRGA